MWRRLAIGALVLTVASTMGRGAHADDLVGRPMLGVVMEEPEEGVVVVARVLPGTTAALLGLSAGDRLVSIGGREIRGTRDVGAALRDQVTGSVLRVVFERDGERHEAEGTLRAMPREESAEFDVLHEHVTSRGARLRTIVTRPKKEGRLPAVLFIQGLGPSVMNAPFGADGPYRRMIDHWTREGFVTMRMEKPGAADSEGGPYETVDFETETAGFGEALAALAARDYVDPEAVFVFGHSMGGIMAPLITSKAKIRGAIVYGTSARTWVEYMLDNVRRQSLLAGESHGEVDEEIRRLAGFLDAVYREGRTQAEALEAFPDLKQGFGPGELQYGKPLAFFRQIAATNLAAAWEAFPGDVFAIWGEADFVTAPDDHDLIAAIVNAQREGAGRYEVLAGADHGFRIRGTQEEAFGARGPAPFAEEILSLTTGWMRERVMASAPR